LGCGPSILECVLRLGANASFSSSFSGFRRFSRMKTRKDEEERSYYFSKHAFR
jgi:hypothetical protein